MDLILAGRETAGVVDDDLLLVVEVVPVQLLVLTELGGVGTEREARGTPDVPWRPAAHLPGLTGLHTADKAVLLPALAGRVVSVHVVVLGQTDVKPLKPPQHLRAPVLSPQPGEHQGVGHKVVVVRVVQEHSVVQSPVKTKHHGVSHHVSFQLLREGEGVTMSQIYRGQSGIPESFVLGISFSVEVMYGIFDGVVKREGFVLDTFVNLLKPRDYIYVYFSDQSNLLCCLNCRTLL